jgi:5S rRNA maturation endonuclease (ribonuclease M5)
VTAMENTQRLEALEKAIDMLNDRGLPLIVEGDRDVDALIRIGITVPIIKINQGVSLMVFCEQVAKRYKEVIILTDWDRKGHELMGKLKRNFTTNEVKVDTDTRLAIFNICRPECRQVEAVDTLLERLRSPKTERLKRDAW